ncbi:hypothetical protein ACFWMH_27510 [Streptomyces tendae]|uniref:hypothetical protein n=1 Tax=Streptomyces tendae TaxID=1932 RepID=UPI003645F87A
MPTATITETDLIRRYADDIAYVAEEGLAADLDTFIAQLRTVARRFELSRVDGYTALDAAVIHLDEAQVTLGDADRSALYSQANRMLYHLGDMTQEYREMVGD